MTEAVRDAYDGVAELYANLFLGDLDRVVFDREWLGAFADTVLGGHERGMAGPGTVAEVGCGPGHVVNHLAELGLTAIGYDLSPAMIAEARQRFPSLTFDVGDLTALDVADDSLAGVVSRYSVIHMAPAELPQVFGELFRVLRSGAPVLVSFFAAESAETHGQPFDHQVATAYELFPETLVEQMRNVGFMSFEIARRDPLEGERPIEHGTILALA